MTLRQFLSDKLTAVDGIPVESMSWAQGVTEPIDEETYDDRLEILPPRWMNGHIFAFGEGAGPFSIFWKQANRYFVTHLSEADTELFCELARVSLHQ